jgi:hypothetical protein
MMKRNTTLRPFGRLQRFVVNPSGACAYLQPKPIRGATPARENRTCWALGDRRDVSARENVQSIPGFSGFSFVLFVLIVGFHIIAVSTDDLINVDVVFGMNPKKLNRILIFL